MADGDDQNDAPQSLAASRSRRQKKDRVGRTSAFEKLRQVKEKGVKHKLEVVEEQQLYDEVDEKEYSKIVRDRQEDDWIVDDDGSGYVEDGREIFDDEYEGEEDTSGASGNKKKGGKKKVDANIRKPNSKPSNIRSMFAAAAGKSKPKPDKEVKLQDDDLLGDIMSEMHRGSSSLLKPIQPAVQLKKTTPRRPPNKFAEANKPSQGFLSLKPPSAQRVQVAPPLEPRVKQPVKTSSLAVALDSQGHEEEEDVVIDSQSQVEPSPVIEDFPDSEDIDMIEAEKSASESLFLDDDGFDEEMTSQEATPKTEDKKETKPKLPELNTSTWEFLNQTVESPSAAVETPSTAVTSSQLPLTVNEDGDQVLRMYWFDAFEDQYKQPGVVYLIGKVYVPSVKTHLSCCVAVKQINRRVWLLPRPYQVDLQTGEVTDKQVTMMEVYNEFDSIAEKNHIRKFKSMKTTKSYAFEGVDVPAESEYLEVHYSAEYPALSPDLKGATFSHVFGANTNSLELLVLNRKLKGPCWLDIKAPQIPKAPVTWTKVEAFVDGMGNISVTPTQPPVPPLVVMTLSLKTLPTKDHHNEVVAVAGLVHQEFYLDRPAPKPLFQQHFCVVCKPSETVFPYDFKEQIQKKITIKVEQCLNERAMLTLFLGKIQKTDPDIIVGHDIFSFDLDVLLHRINHNKVPQWSRIGRLKRAAMPKQGSAPGAKSSAGAIACAGRLVCDVKVSAKELMNCRSYDLTELCSQVLKESRQELDPDQILACYSESQHLIQLLEWTLVDCNLILRLMAELNVLPLALQITTICGNIMSRTLMGGRAERNEFLLLHAFTEKQYIPPDKRVHHKKHAPAVEDETLDHADHDTTAKPGDKKASGRRKPAYAGGLVLDPKRGFYDTYILLLDFNSLYPSIIQEYNICFTTITKAPPSESKTEQDEPVDEIDSLTLPDSDVDPGVLPTEIRKLVQSRREVKKLMKQPNLSHDVHMQYDIRQKALKLTANSMYGCLGFSFSRFYAKPLAALITSKGREILMKTKELAEGMSLDVIYGDTDSIMINSNSTNLDDVYKLGGRIKGEVNKLYRTLEIEIDGVFQSMLLLKKKKYAALSINRAPSGEITTTQELKGLDIVRRDWCQLAKKAGSYVITEILSGQIRDTIVDNIHSKLMEIGEQVSEGQVPLEMYYITKQLTKNPEDYPDSKSLPHVQVALRYNSKGGRKLRSGDTVYYIVCEDGTTLSASQRAYHPDELQKNQNLLVDKRYYLSNQVHPVVARLCDPIEGTDAARIAECLGLDPSGYRHTVRSHEDDEDDVMLGGAEVSDAEKYKNCQRFQYPCHKCQEKQTVEEVFVEDGTSVRLTLEKCRACGVNLLFDPDTGKQWLKRIINYLRLDVRSFVSKYYQGWMKCDDSACAFRQRQTSFFMEHNTIKCPSCMRSQLHPEYSDQDLYYQLCFYQHLFDIEQALKNKEGQELRTHREAARTFTEHYRIVKLHMDKLLNLCAYAEINLTQLFGAVFNC